MMIPVELLDGPLEGYHVSWGPDDIMEIEIKEGDFIAPDYYSAVLSPTVTYKRSGYSARYIGKEPRMASKTEELESRIRQLLAENSELRIMYNLCITKIKADEYAVKAYTELMAQFAGGLYIYTGDKAKGTEGDNT